MDLGENSEATKIQPLQGVLTQGEVDILVLGDEPHLPYHHPPLSITFLAGEKTAEDLAIRPAAFYEKISSFAKVA